MITSADNQNIKYIRQLLTKKKARDEQKVFVCEGIKMFEEALANDNITIKKAFISEQLYNTGYEKIKNVDYDIVKESLFKQISETVTPQGILAIIEQPHFDIDIILKNDNVKLLVIEDIQDPGNLGTMIRTAEAAGCSAVVASRGTVDIFNPKVIRSTMGAIYRVPYIQPDMALSDWMREILKPNSITTYAACLDGSEDYKSVIYTNRSAILIGNEGNGLTEETKQASDYRIHIPMAGEVESLNAAISAAILLYH